MLTRRDQLQSYQFLMQRVVSAVSIRDTDPVTPPFRRFLVSGTTGIVLACLIMAGAGIYGLIVPGGSERWRTDDKVIVERDTGALYVFKDQRLVRVANYASGVLLLGVNHGTVTVSRNSLLGVPRGPEVGIAGAPSGLPPADKLLGTPWTLCSQIVTDETGTDLASTVLLIGEGVDGGVSLGDVGLLAENIEDGTLHLVVNGYRHAITDERAAMVGLALSREPRVRAGTAWLNALPAGVDLAPPSVGERGKPSQVPETLIGQLVVAGSGGTQQHYVAVEEGLRAVTELEFALLSASEATEAAYPDGQVTTRELSVSEAANWALPSTPVAGPEQLPRTRPAMSSLAADDTVACAPFTGLDSPPEISIGGTLPVTRSDLVTARRTTEGTVIADRVLIAPGQGALVEAVQGPEAPGVVHLITEQGVRYPLASADVVTTLGYAPSDIVRLPAELVARVAEGPPLDPEAAGTVLLQH